MDGLEHTQQAVDAGAFGRTEVACRIISQRVGFEQSRLRFQAAVKKMARYCALAVSSKPFSYCLWL